MCVRKCILATIQPKNKLRSPTPGMTYRSLHLLSPILTGRDEAPTAAAILGDNAGSYACC